MDSLGFFKYTQVLVSICGFPWVWWVPVGLVGSSGFLRGFSGSLGFLKFQRTFLVILGTFEFSWVSVGSLWVWWVPMGFFGFSWVL